MLPSDASQPTKENEGDDYDVNTFNQYIFGHKLWALCAGKRYC